MTSATDIITYIGVPLAVIGVLPILYTLLRALLTLRSIRQTLLRHGHVPASNTRPDGFTARSSPMTSLIEVDLPRYTIAPLDRGDPAYWKLDLSSFAGDRHALLRTDSTLSMIEEGRVQGFLRGGSWRTFHLKKLVVGRKLYRSQWEDELREPPAEMDFTDLVHFLMDWGALPDAHGWEKLKHGGLWTPGGTVLLRRGDGEDEKLAGDWVLRTSIPDESDGVLSLSVRWNNLGSTGSDRGIASLPPGWARLDQPGKGRFSNQMGEKGLVKRIDEARHALSRAPESESVRFCIEGAQVSQVLWEHNGVATGECLDLWPEGSENGASLWFTCACSALSRCKQVGGGLWGFDMPSHVVTFVRKESIPCGVMVLLGMIAEIDTPAWSSDTSGDLNGPTQRAQRHHRRFMERVRKMDEERAMPPEQARIASMNRMMEERLALQDDMVADARQRSEQEEGRLRDAVASPRFSNKAVAEACLAWMIDQQQVGRDCTLQTLAEAVLYLLVVDSRPNGEAAGVIEVLDEWQVWSQHGGMKKSHVAFLTTKKVEFCCAVALVHIIEEAATTSTHSGEVMKECLRSWRKVRLG